MNAWLKAFNPLAAIGTEAEALRAARASAISLWLSGAKWILGAALMVDDMPRMRAAIASSSSPSDVAIQNLVGGGLAEATVIITGCLGLFQILMGVVQWRKPNTSLPAVFLVLSVYGLGTALWGQLTGGGTGAPWSVAVSYATLVVAVVFHWAGLRGAVRLRALQRGL